jgi:DNA-binding FadR family transcriptional regulator
MERVYRRIMAELLDEIVAGRIPQGGPLPKVEDIAARHACSRGAAREALRALEERSVIAVHAGQGQTVRGPDEWALLDRDVAEATLLRHGDPQLLREGIDALRLIEIEAVKLVAQRVSDGDVRYLAQTVELMRRFSRSGNGAADLGEQFAAAEEDFHRTLILIGGNRFIASALESLHPVIASVRLAKAAERDPAVVRAHETIVAALEARDATAAAAAIDGYYRHLASWLRA